MIPAAMKNRIPSVKTEKDAMNSSWSQVIPAALQIENSLVVKRITLLPAPVSPFRASCRSDLEPYMICAAGLISQGL
jgi:hypothetical protein